MVVTISGERQEQNLKFSLPLSRSRLPIAFFSCLLVKGQLYLLESHRVCGIVSFLNLYFSLISVVLEEEYPMDRNPKFPRKLWECSTLEILKCF